jgi:ADP-heptose:LPS heptosyltransferase
MTSEARIATAHERLERGGRVLVTRMRYVGDAILSLPLVAALRGAFPAAEIHYLAQAPALELLHDQPDLARCWRAEPGVVATLRLAQRLRAQRFDAAIDLFANPWSALLVRATGAPVRIGEARRVRRHAYTWARRLPPGRSALLQHLDALRGLGVEPPAPEPPVLRLRGPEIEAGRARWRRQASAPGVLLHLGATQPAKEWPVEHAVELVRRLEHDGVPVLLSTAPNRPEPSATVAARSGGTAHCMPALPLREVLGVAAAAAAVVSVDGAVAHAAVALGRPTVALFGPTDPDIWFPYGEFGPYRVLHAGPDCGPCDGRCCAERRCMHALEPEAVQQAVYDLWAAPRPGAVHP